MDNVSHDGKRRYTLGVKCVRANWFIDCPECPLHHPSRRHTCGLRLLYGDGGWENHARCLSRGWEKAKET